MMTRLIPATKTPSQQGFSLVELSVVLIVIGLLLGAAASLIRPYIESYRYTSTQQKIEAIADALANYARINYDLPCPVDPTETTAPFGTPAGSGVDGHRVDMACKYSSFSPNSGIVPFRTLGLDENQVKDAYGNYITYVLPAVWNIYKTLEINELHNSSVPVHKECRTAKWIDYAVDAEQIYGLTSVGIDDVLPVDMRKNRNARKARFCCPWINNQGVNVYSDRQALASQKLFISRSDPAYRLLTDQAGTRELAPWHMGANPSAGLTSTSEMVAFVLVSHGKNGDGAILRNGSQRPVSTSVATTQETPNRTLGTRELVMRPQSLQQDADYFDDIVVWRTNRQLISGANGESCASP